MSVSLKYKHIYTISDVINTILLLVGILQMYNGIEIEHPVFRVLFWNLIVAFFLSAVSVIIYFFEKIIKYSTFVYSCNTFYIMFHCCCWLIVSLLWFVYIFHKDWLFEQFPDPNTLNRLVVASVFLIFLICWSILIAVGMLCGWPRIKVFEMGMPQRAITFGTLLGIFTLLIGFSCSFYVLILRKRGRLRNNKVENGNPKEEIEQSVSDRRSNQFGNVWIGDSPTNDDGLHQGGQRQVSVNEEVQLFNNSYKPLNIIMNTYINKNKNYPETPKLKFIKNVIFFLPFLIGANGFSSDYFAILTFSD
jgi:hypothetical protein